MAMAPAIFIRALPISSTLPLSEIRLVAAMRPTMIPENPRIAAPPCANAQGFIPPRSLAARAIMAMAPAIFRISNPNLSTSFDLSDIFPRIATDAIRATVIPAMERRPFLSAASSILPSILTAAATAKSAMAI